MSSVTEFLRRHRWVVTLAVIAVIAAASGSFASELMATLLLRGASPKKVSLPRPPEVTEQNLLPRPAQSLSALFDSRNIFDAEPREEKNEEASESKPDQPGQSLADLGVGLVATLVSNREDWSIAVMTVDGESKLVRRGVRIRDTAEVVKIARKYVVLQLGQDQRIVKLGEGAPKRPGPPGALSLRPRYPWATQHRRSNPAARGVKQLAPYEYAIDRGMLEENLRDLTKLGMQARIIPNYVGGKYHGFRLVGMRPDSLYRAIGLESGDLITRVNGVDIDTPNKALQLFEQLRSASTITLDLQRRGKKITMTYKIK